jgi:hypothetical protein
MANSHFSRAKPLTCDRRHALDLAARLNHKENIQFVTCVDGNDGFLWHVQVHVARVIPSAVRDHAQHVTITIDT